MIQITPHMRLLVAHQSVDFRKGIDGLVRICKDQLQQDPFLGTVFVFRNRLRTGIKLLVYDGQGFWLCQKRLSKGRFKWWPTQGQKASELEAFGLQILLAAGDPSGASTLEPWRPLNPTGPKFEVSSVPENAIRLHPHDHHEI